MNDLDGALALPVYRTISQTRQALKGAGPIAMVPTMGALHAGHLALIRHAATLGERVVVSIFVNPLQFGPNEDFRRYPRALANDVAAAREAGATDIFAPEVDELTPPGLTVTVDPGPMGDLLEGKFRPGHFRGVCTIVLKLFNVVQPQVAVFGWKDAQQFIILRKMVRDLDLPVEMVGMETVREADGLAMSSRNAYLSSEERAVAPRLQAILQEAKRSLMGGMEVAKVEKEAEDGLAAAGFVVDYVKVVSATDLTELKYSKGESTLIAAAARLGRTRLIDNLRW